MLTFNIPLGYQVLRDFLFIFFLCFFFQSDRPTQYQETHSTLNEKKRGMAFLKVVGILYSWPLFLVFF